MGRPIDWITVAISLLFLVFGLPMSDRGGKVEREVPAYTGSEASGAEWANVTPIPERHLEAVDPRVVTAHWQLAPAERAPGLEFVEGGLPQLVLQQPRARFGGDPGVWASMEPDLKEAGRRF